MYDVVFVGGGLANGLAAYRTQRKQPQKRLLLLEAGAKLGGVHTWSFHGSDVGEHIDWLRPFISKSWPKQELRFPRYEKLIETSYHSVMSEQFHERLMGALAPSIRLNETASIVSRHELKTKDGQSIFAKCIVDGSGWKSEGRHELGYQKFVGLTVKLKCPHELVYPVIMDATVSQRDGYRFYYLLPWDKERLLIEDTHYADGPEVDVDKYREEILTYASKKNWEVQSIEYEEVGSLPIPLSGPAPSNPKGVVLSGLRAGLFQATTGYSFPDAVRFAELASSVQDWSDERIPSFFSRYTHSHWKRNAFCRMLNRFLFRAAKDDQRYLILERFYRLSRHRIERFYSGELNWMDKLAILVGKPPVPITAAMRQILAKRQNSRISKGQMHSNSEVSWN